jgi:hypothetical protein
MDFKQPIYEARMGEVTPKELNFTLRSVKVALFGFNQETDRYIQIEKALDFRYSSHSTATVSHMRKDQIKKIKRRVKDRMLRRPDFSTDGVLILPLEAAWPSQSGDDPRTLI